MISTCIVGDKWKNNKITKSTSFYLQVVKAVSTSSKKLLQQQVQTKNFNQR